MVKVAKMFGLAGACRRDELAHIEVDDIEDNNVYCHKIQVTKPRAIEAPDYRYMITDVTFSPRRVQTALRNYSFSYLRVHFYDIT
ncbi:unnamed protein product [Acanthoscelides obtectus]|uniref:Uncharacterized protein n=1 Tax=Acanthoscelides obtectus TaxID=200917 RepID=A0A9P0LI70_ACAOB|nr:unnamed protein product [Acanthoscelides obtectus]CAK1624879.1 hypothetical protein AOBTE_LOCUS2818 [Acanthoscelides obtectus]